MDESRRSGRSRRVSGWRLWRGVRSGGAAWWGGGLGRGGWRWGVRMSGWRSGRGFRGRR